VKEKTHEATVQEEVFKRYLLQQEYIKRLQETQLSLQIHQTTTSVNIEKIDSGKTVP
jgi:hypothetical protein